MKRNDIILLIVIITMIIAVFFNILDNGIPMDGSQILTYLPADIADDPSGTIIDTDSNTEERGIEFEMDDQDTAELYRILSEGNYRKVREEKYGTFNGDMVIIGLPKQGNELMTYMEINGYGKLNIEDYETGVSVYCLIEDEDTKTQLEEFFTSLK